MSEKAISIGHYFVTSGVYTVFGVICPYAAHRYFRIIYTMSWKGIYGGMWDIEADPIKHAHMMIAHIDKKRKDLGIDKARERVLMDMADRRELEEHKTNKNPLTKEEKFMSKIVAFAVIQGGYNIVSKAEGEYKEALETYDAAQRLEFPNTAYYLPVIYSFTGIKVTDLDSETHGFLAGRFYRPMSRMNAIFLISGLYWMQVWRRFSPMRLWRPSGTLKTPISTPEEDPDWKTESSGWVRPMTRL